MDIRKVAILVSRMDSETAELLMADLSDEQRDLIRAAITELDGVSPAELQAVAAELQEATAECEVDELYSDGALPLSPVRPLDGPPGLMASSHPRQDSLATVLRNSSVESLLRVLRDEYPQTLAAVVSRLQPEDAAKFLAGLADVVRADVMRRVAEMDATDSDVMADVSDEIASLVDSELSQVDGALVGRDAVKAILFAAKGEHRNRLIDSLSVGDLRLATQLGVARERNPDAVVTDDGGGNDSQRWTFERVTSLDSTALANVVRSADFEVVLLALVGASPGQVERFLSGLSANESSRFRRRLSAIGPVRLRDIEFAQRQLTAVAQRAYQGGKGCASSSRSKGLTLSV